MNTIHLARFIGSERSDWTSAWRQKPLTPRLPRVHVAGRLFSFSRKATIRANTRPCSDFGWNELAYPAAESPSERELSSFACHAFLPQGTSWVASVPASFKRTW